MQEQETNQENKELEKFNISLNKLTLGGFIVMCLIVLQVFGTATPDVAIYIALGSIAVAIPLLTSYFILLTSQENKFIKDKDWTIGWVIGNVVEGIGIAGSIIALDAALWHVHWLIGVIFLVSTLVAAIFFFSYIYHNDITFGPV